MTGFALPNGMDARLTPARADLAARYLEGRVPSIRFVDGTKMQVRPGIVPLRMTPDPDAHLATQLIKGEPFTVYESKDGWAWGQADKDNYVGYVPSNSLTQQLETPTARISAVRSHIYAEPSHRALPLSPLTMNATVAAGEIDNGFARLADGGFVSKHHIAPLDDTASDFTATALVFLGTPYLWGGRSGIGIDCSGLVQMVLERAGIASPRDADMQEQALGQSVPVKDLQRGDLIFWKGHVAIALDAAQVVHANGTYMTTMTEALEAVCARAGTITSVKRVTS